MFRWVGKCHPMSESELLVFTFLIKVIDKVIWGCSKLPLSLTSQVVLSCSGTGELRKVAWLALYRAARIALVAKVTFSCIQLLEIERVILLLPLLLYSFFIPDSLVFDFEQSQYFLPLEKIAKFSFSLTLLICIVSKIFWFFQSPSNTSMLMFS